MNYSRTKLLIQTTKEIGKDVAAVSRAIGKSIKGYGNFCYDIYFGDIGAVIAGDIGGITTLSQQMLPPCFLLLSPIFIGDPKLATYTTPIGIALLSEPLLKEGVRAAYKAGKIYFQSKMNAALNTLEK